MRAVHLGLGSFFRAHQAWFTQHADDGWGIAAFAGRRPELARALAAQDGVYPLVTRSAERDAVEFVESVSRVHTASEHEAWLDHLGDPDVGVVTLTVTEAGYRIPSTDDAVQSDIRSLRDDARAPAGTVAARLVAGLLERRARGAGPVTLVPCDNLPDNGAALRHLVGDCARQVDPSLAHWLDENLDVASTVVDRITPAPTDADRRTVLELTGVDDPCAVATEPFAEWVLAGAFRAGRPNWERAGAVLTDDVTPYEQRKLWLLNGAHSLLAYLGSARGHTTVADAIHDAECRRAVEDWWDACGPWLPFPVADLVGYRTALLERFANPRIRHALAQIAVDGSQKLPARILPVVRASGQIPAPAALVLAAWISWVRRGDVPDVRAAELSVAARSGDPVPRLLATLDPELADDAAVVDAVRTAAADLPRRAG